MGSVWVSIGPRGMMTDSEMPSECATYHVPLSATPFCVSPLCRVVAVLKGAALRLRAWQHLSVIHACRSLEWVLLSKLRQYAAEQGERWENTKRGQDVTRVFPTCSSDGLHQKFTCSTKVLKSGRYCLGMSMQGTTQLHVTWRVCEHIPYTRTQSLTQSPTSLPIACQQALHLLPNTCRKGADIYVAYLADNRRTSQMKYLTHFWLCVFSAKAACDTCSTACIAHRHALRRTAPDYINTTRYMSIKFWYASTMKRNNVDILHDYSGNVHESMYKYIFDKLYTTVLQTYIHHLYMHRIYSKVSTYA